MANGCVHIVGKIGKNIHTVTQCVMLESALGMSLKLAM